MRRPARALAAVGACIGILALSLPAMAAHGLVGKWEGTWEASAEERGCPPGSGEWTATITQEGGILRVEWWDSFFNENQVAEFPGDLHEIQFSFEDQQSDGTRFEFNGTFAAGEAGGPVTGSFPGLCNYSGEWRGTRTEAGPEPTVEPTEPTTPAEGDVFVGPRSVDLGEGEHMELESGARVRRNNFNLHVEFGRVCFRFIKRFSCPQGYWPAPDPTLSSWIGARCRTVTTPHAGAVLRGTEFAVEVNEATTTYEVFEGTLDVTDLRLTEYVQVDQYESTTVAAGAVPSAPVFDRDAMLHAYRTHGQSTVLPQLLIAIPLLLAGGWALLRGRRAVPALPEMGMPVAFSFADLSPARLPRVCVKTGNPAETVLRKYFYRNPWAKGYSARLKATLPVTRKVARLRRVVIGTAIGVLVVSLSFMFFALYVEQSALLLISLMIVVLAALLLVGTRLLGVRGRIVGDGVEMTGVHPNYVAAINAKRAEEIPWLAIPQPSRKHIIATGISLVVVILFLFGWLVSRLQSNQVEAFAAGRGGVSFQDPEGTFRIDFPKSPERSQQTTAAAGMNLVVINYRADFTDVSFVLSQIDFPVPVQDPNQELSSFVDGVAGSTKGNVTKKSPTTLEGHPAVDYSIRVEDGFLTGRAILVDSRLYALQVKGEVDPPTGAGRFLSSFTLVRSSASALHSHH